MEKKLKFFWIFNFFEYGVFQIDKNKFLKCSKELKIEILKKNFNYVFWKYFHQESHLLIFD